MLCESTVVDTIIIVLHYHFKTLMLFNILFDGMYFISLSNYHLVPLVTFPKLIPNSKKSVVVRILTNIVIDIICSIAVDDLLSIYFHFQYIFFYFMFLIIFILLLRFSFCYVSSHFHHCQYSLSGYHQQKLVFEELILSILYILFLFPE